MSTEAREQLISQIKENYLDPTGDFWLAKEMLMEQCGYTSWEAEELINSWEQEQLEE